VGPRMRVNISGAKNWHLCSLHSLLRTGRDEICGTESDTGIPLLREGVWKESRPQHCRNPSTNYPWYCFNDQQHPFNDGLRKQGGFICINTVYIWYTMDCPANGLLITNMHILTLRPSVYGILPTSLCKPRCELISVSLLERSFQI